MEKKLVEQGDKNERQSTETMKSESGALKSRTDNLKWVKPSNENLVFLYVNLELIDEHTTKRRQQMSKTPGYTSSKTRQPIQFDGGAASTTISEWYTDKLGLKKYKTNHLHGMTGFDGVCGYRHTL
jgi:hypothetical protein